MDSDRPRPLVITRDEFIIRAVTRLCAAASVLPEVNTDRAAVRRAWAGASSIVVGADAAGELTSWSLSRRRDVALVLAAADHSGGWRRAVEVGADRVLTLPDDEASLLGWLTDVSERASRLGVVVGVMGSRGGAGSSTFSVCLATAVRRLGVPSLLVDADAWSGGIELVVGCEAVPGVRWPDLTTAAGRVRGSALREALPHLDGLAVLSTTAASPGRLTPGSVRDVVAAASEAFGCIVVDLPRGSAAWLAEIGPVLDHLLLVATTDLPCAAAAARAAAAAGEWVGDVRLVARDVRGSGIGRQQLAESVGLPLAAAVATRRMTSRAIADGAGPLLGRRSSRDVRALAERLIRLERAVGR